MKRTALSIAGACLAFAAVPAAAQDTIVVAPDSSLEEWRAAMSHNLGERLRDAPSYWERNAGSGIVKIRFRRAADGTPTDVEIVERSGDLYLDGSAARAVRTLEQLDPLPGSIDANQVFQANIISAVSRRTYDRLARDLARDEAERQARSGSEREVLAINLAVAPAG